MSEETEALKFVLETIKACETMEQVAKYGSRTAALAAAVPAIVSRCCDALGYGLEPDVDEEGEA